MSYVQIIPAEGWYFKNSETGRYRRLAGFALTDEEKVVGLVASVSVGENLGHPIVKSVSKDAKGTFEYLPEPPAADKTDGNFSA